jgi:hypothetical protein
VRCDLLELAGLAINPGYRDCGKPGSQLLRLAVAHHFRQTPSQLAPDFVKVGRRLVIRLALLHVMANCLFGWMRELAHDYLRYGRATGSPK